MSLIHPFRKLNQNCSNVIKGFQNGGFSRLIHKNNILYRTKYPKTATCCDGETNQEMDVKCKVAFVTGGTTGIGFAVASELLNEGAHRVAITGLDACRGKEAINCLNNSYGRDRAMYINCNVNCMVQFEEAFRACRDAYKRIDIVVNAAGICDGSQWEREIVTNVVGTIRGTLLAYRYVGREGTGTGGAIVNIAGTGGLEPLPSAPTLAASQHAIIGLSRSFGDGSHVQRSGVRVVTLCPGFTRTDFIKNVQEKAMTEFMGDELSKAIKKAKKQKPEACGQAVVHLLKHGKTGTVWVIEGSRLFALNLPDRATYSVLSAQFL